MTNVISILQSVGKQDLVLLDEVGAGTDPQEGSALARALMDEFLKTGALVIATTHYTEVKAYASTTGRGREWQRRVRSEVALADLPALDRDARPIQRAGDRQTARTPSADR